MKEQQRFTALGKIVSFLLVAGLIGLGVYMIRGRGDGPSGGGTPDEQAAVPEVAEIQVEVPTLAPATRG